MKRVYFAAVIVWLGFGLIAVLQDYYSDCLLQISLLKLVVAVAVVVVVAVVKMYMVC